MIKRIGILTSGGDAPGMNAAIIAITKSALIKGVEVFYIYEGYRGLVNGMIEKASQLSFEKRVNMGGTMLYTARFNEFKQKVVQKKAKSALEKWGIEALIVIGGDGTYMGAQALHELGVKTIAIPGTIDNDISSTEYTIGYDTALNTIIENVDKIRNTAESHKRVALIEVMGRGRGDLALYAGMATGAEIIVTSDNKLSKEKIAHQVKELFKKGKRSVIVIVSEHTYDDLYVIAKEVQDKTGVPTRANIFAHLQRGGSPTAMDRIYAWRLGNYSVELLMNDESGLALGIIEGKVKKFKIKKALEMKSPDRKNLLKKVNAINKYFDY